MDNEGTQSQFAKKYGYSRAAITQFKNAGRLVFIRPGILDFKASKQRIIDTSDPNRSDVAKRHAELRNQESEEDKITTSSNSFQNIRTVKEKYLALQAKLDYEVSSGSLVEWEKVEKVISERGMHFKDGLLLMSRKIAPLIAGKDDVQEIELIITKEIKAIIEEFRKLPRIQ